jgi:hypothetical protein
MKTVDITVKDGTKEVKHSYELPASLDEFKKLVAASKSEIKDGVEKNVFYARHCYAEDLKQRASVRESVAADTTIVTRKEFKVDLFTGEVRHKDIPDKVARILTVPQRVIAINAVLAQSAVEGGEPQRAYLVAFRKLVESKVVTEKDGMLVITK